MKVSRLALAAVLAAGCLPAYDNSISSPLGQVDMASADGPGGDMPVTGSGQFVTLKATALETEQNVAGPTAYFYGYPQLTSMPADATGNVKIEIPSTLLGASTGAYVVFEGSVAGTPILKTVVAPVKYGTAAIGAASAPFTHYFLKSDDSGIRGQVGKELAAASLIPSAAAIATDFSIAYGALVYTSGGFTRYHGFSVKVTDNGVDSPTSGCDPKTQCCIYYTTCSYTNWKNNLVGCGAGQPFLSLAATTGIGEYFAVVCPAKGTAVDTMGGDVTLTQTQPTASLMDSTGTPPPKDFPPFTMPKVPGDGVHLEWWISD